MDVIETPRLLLRRWSEESIEDLRALSSDPQVMRYVGPGKVWEEELIQEKHRETLEHWEKYGYGWRIAVDRTDGSLVGLAALNRLGPIVEGLPESYHEIGWWITPRRWRQGFGTECGLALREDAFRRLGAECIVGRYRPANLGSGRIMDKLGMTSYTTYVDRFDLPVHVKILRVADWKASRDDG